jgi:hypothetical protein
MPITTFFGTWIVLGLNFQLFMLVWVFAHLTAENWNWNWTELSSSADDEPDDFLWLKFQEVQCMIMIKGFNDSEEIPEIEKVNTTNAGSEIY